MTKIDQVQPLKNQAVTEPKKGAEKSAPVTDNTFRQEIEASLRKMEGITDKIKGSMNVTGDKVNTNVIIKEVKQARIILDELSNTFSSIKNTNENSSPASDVTHGMKKYSQAKNIDNPVIKERKIT